ncbi:MAG: class II aldolase/adducin family protein [Burkholderiales bacterium]|nr:class II aldolase/adducin family protein [Burkholderiales bacterium]
MPDAEWAVRCDLAAAYRLVALFGWTYLIGNHLSARVPGTDDEFLLNPYGMMFEEITASSLVKVDQHGKLLSDTEYIVNPAGFVIHGCIHAARPDLDCVIHLHTRDGGAVATQDEGLLPITQNALLIYDQVTYHDYEGVALDMEERARLLADLGDKRIMILRNHGTLTAGRTVAEAFVTMYRLEKACEMQIAAQSGGGKLRALPPAVVQGTIETGKRIYSKGGLSPEGAREWKALLRKLERDDPGYRQ